MEGKITIIETTISKAHLHHSIPTTTESLWTLDLQPQLEAEDFPTLADQASTLEDLLSNPMAVLIISFPVWKD